MTRDELGEKRSKLYTEKQDIEIHSGQLNEVLQVSFANIAKTNKQIVQDGIRIAAINAEIKELTELIDLPTLEINEQTRAEYINTLESQALEKLRQTSEYLSIVEIFSNYSTLEFPLMMDILNNFEEKGFVVSAQPGTAKKYKAVIPNALRLRPEGVTGNSGYGSPTGVSGASSSIGIPGHGGDDAGDPEVKMYGQEKLIIERIMDFLNHANNWVSLEQIQSMCNGLYISERLLQTILDKYTKQGLIYSYDSGQKIMYASREMFDKQGSCFVPNNFHGPSSLVNFRVEAGSFGDYVYHSEDEVIKTTRQEASVTMPLSEYVLMYLKDNEGVSVWRSGWISFDDILNSVRHNNMGSDDLQFTMDYLEEKGMVVRNDTLGKSYRIFKEKTN